MQQSRAWTAPLGNHGSGTGWGQRGTTEHHLEPAPPEEDAPETLKGTGRTWMVLLPIIPSSSEHWRKSITSWSSPRSFPALRLPRSTWKRQGENTRREWWG